VEQRVRAKQRASAKKQTLERRASEASTHPKLATLGRRRRVRQVLRRGGFGGSPPDCPRFCPLLPRGRLLASASTFA
jgi:hypothetical protein